MIADTHIETVRPPINLRSLDGRTYATPRPDKPEPGIDFTRFAIALGVGAGNLPQALEIAKERYSDSPAIVTSLKAAVGAGTTTGTTWAAPLVDTYQRLAGEFIEYLRPQTILGKFGARGVPSLTKVPFNISVPRQTTGGDGYWVGQGKAKPLTKFDFENVTLGWAKVANIAVVTEELLRFSNPDAERIVRGQLAAALIERLDKDFVDPAKAEVANVSPSSITNGVTPIPSSGADIDAIREDVKALFGTYLAANLPPTSAVFIMPTLVALCLSLMTNPLGQPEFPGLTMFGGTFFNVPCITSDYVSNGTVILANAQDIFLADDGQVTVDVSREASLEMSDSPVGDSTTPTGANLVSLWQTNSVGFRAERYINWTKRRPQAVAMLSGVTWGGAIGS